MRLARVGGWEEDGLQQTAVFDGLIPVSVSITGQPGVQFQGAQKTLRLPPVPLKAEQLGAGKALAEFVYPLVQTPPPQLLAPIVQQQRRQNVLLPAPGDEGEAEEEGVGGEGIGGEIVEAEGETAVVVRPELTMYVFAYHLHNISVPKNRFTTSVTVN